MPPSASQDANKLLAEAVAGSEHALTLLYKLHSAHVATVVYRALGTDADLDDIVQDTFVEAFRSLASVREPERFRSFLVTVAMRRIYARMSFRYRVRDLIKRLFPLAKRSFDTEPLVGLQALQELLGRVPQTHRAAWVLHRVEGYTLPEVAQQLGRSLATSKRWIAAVDLLLEAEHAHQ